MGQIYNPNGGSGTGGVSSLNLLTGPLTLTSTGGTVTITVSGSTINLEAAGGGLSAIPAYSVLANNTASSAVPTGQQTLNLGVLGFTDIGIIESLASSNTSYNQEIIQNTNTGTGASSNFVAANNATTATTNFGEFGINSSNFTGSSSFNLPGAVYLDSTSVDLVIGTTTANAVHFVTNSAATDAGSISSAGAWTLNNSLALNGPQTITSASSVALTVGANGSTNPALLIDSSTASSATGIAIKSAASGGTTTITATDSGASSSLDIEAKGTGALNIANTSTGSVQIGNSSSLQVVLAASASVGVRVQISGSIRNTFGASNVNFANAAASNTATLVRYSVTGPTDGALTASTEAPNAYWNYGQLRNHATGALTLQRDFRITGTQHTFTAASTLSDWGVFSVDFPASLAFTNATITRGSVILVPSVALGAGVVDSFAANLNSSTGATRNWAARFGGQLLYASATPGIAAGAGAGSSPTVTIAGVEEGGLISITTGASPGSSGVIATITYNNAFPTGSNVVLYPANAATALLSGVSMVFTTGNAGNFTITSGTVALTTLTAYTWYYQVIGY